MTYLEQLEAQVMKLENKIVYYEHELQVAHAGINRLTTDFLKLSSIRRAADEVNVELNKKLDQMVRFIQS